MKNRLIAFTIIGILVIISLAINELVSTNQYSALNAEMAFAQTKDAKPAAPEASGIYEFDPVHSTVGFRIKHFGLIDVPGSFTDYTGTINYDAKDVAKSSVQFTAKIASINTKIERRDNHLRSADFFDAQKFPEMTFKSTKVEKKGDDFVATGDFTLKGVTKQIAIPFQIVGIVNKDSFGKMRMGVAAALTINRQDYGISWNRTLDNGALVLDNDVKIDLQIEATKQEPKPVTTN